MEEKTKNIIVGVSIGTAILSLLGISYCADQMNAVKSMVGASTERIRNLSHVDIDRGMVDRMVEDSVRKQAGDAARAAAMKAKDEIMTDMRNRVKQAVNNQKGEIAKKVAAKFAEEISETDKNDIISDVIDATTDKLIEKLGDDLDSEVGRIGKIYKGIAAVMQ